MTVVNADLRGKKRSRKREGFVYFLFILPVLVLVLLFMYKPLLGWYYAFTDYKPGRLLENTSYVGFKNFQRIFYSRAYTNQVLRVVQNTLIMAFMGIFMGSPLTVAFAILLSEMRSAKARRIVQTLTTLPHFISVVTLYAIVYFMLSYGGFVNSLLMSLKLIETPINFLTTADGTYIKMWLYNVWKNIGWSAIIYLAAIAGIDQELYEAVAIDGGGRFRKIWHITVPGILPTFFVLLVMGIGNLLNSGYAMQYVFQNSMNKKYIEVLDLYVYNQGIGEGNVPFATAVGILKSFIALVLFSAGNGISKLVRGTSVF